MKVDINKIIYLIWKYLFAFIERVKHEPVLVRTVLTLLIAGGIVEISDAKLDQIDSIVLVIVILLGGVATRRNVKPLSQEEKTERRQNRRKLIPRRKNNDK
jgi:hypothetical protein